MSVSMPLFLICVTAFSQSPDQTNLALYRELLELVARVANRN